MNPELATSGSEPRVTLLSSCGVDLLDWAPRTGEATSAALARITDPAVVLDLSVRVGDALPHALGEILAAFVSRYLEVGGADGWGKLPFFERELARVTAAHHALAALKVLGALRNDVADLERLREACQELTAAAEAGMRGEVVSLPRELAVRAIDLAPELESARLVAALVGTPGPRPWWRRVQRRLEQAAGAPVGPPWSDEANMIASAREPGGGA